MVAVATLVASVGCRGGGVLHSYIRGEQDRGVLWVFLEQAESLLDPLRPEQLLASLYRSDGLA